MSDNNFNGIMNRVSLIKIYGTIWNDEESGITAFAQQIWDYERNCWVSDYPDLFGGGDPAELPDIPLIDKTLTQHDQAADAYEVGIRLGNLTNIINNLPVPTEDKYRGNITLANLLLLESPDDGLAYNVFLSGNETDGYSTDNFMFDGVSHPAGSRAIYVSDHWVIKDVNEDKTYKVAAFEALQEKLVLPKNILSGYAHTYAASVSHQDSGIHLFDAYVYNLTPEGYEREYTAFGTPSGQRMTDLWTVSVPYAEKRTYLEGGVIHTEYHEGALSKELCRYLYEHSHNWDEIENKPEFGAAAFSNDYNDLINKPEALNLHTVAYSGDYNELNNKPTIPAAQVPSDWNASSGPSRILNKPNIPENVVRYVTQNLTSEQQAQARSNIGAGTSNFSGDYNDLSNKPIIPDISNFVTLDTSQTITGTKRFRNSDWGQISLWAEGSNREYPCINYYSVQPTLNTEFVGSIGVVRTDYLQGYPAYWASQQGTPQKLIRDVDVDPVLQSGTKIAEIGGKDIYAPSGDGQSQTPNNGRLLIKSNGSPVVEFYADDTNNPVVDLEATENKINSIDNTNASSTINYPSVSAVTELIGYRELLWLTTSYDECSVPIIVDKKLLSTKTLVIRLLLKGSSLGYYIPRYIQFYDPENKMTDAFMQGFKIIFLPIHSYPYGRIVTENTGQSTTTYDIQTTSIEGNMHRGNIGVNSNGYLLDKLDIFVMNRSSDFVNNSITPRWSISVTTTSKSNDPHTYFAERFEYVYRNNTYFWERAAWGSLNEVLSQDNPEMVKYL